MTKAVEDFVERLMVHFSDTRERDQAWADSMIAELKGFSAEVLNKAAANIVRTRKYRNFPLLSECIAACKDAQSWVDAEANKGRFQLEEVHASGDGKWTALRVEFAYNKLRSSKLAKKAANDKPCWVLAYWNFCRENEREPAGAEISGCMREAEEFDRLFADLVAKEGKEKARRTKASVERQSWNYLPSAWRGYSDSILARREKYRKIALGMQP